MSDQSPIDQTREQPAQPGPGYGYSYPPPAPPTNSLAVVALVAGIAGLTIVPLIGSIVAVVTGHMARKQIRATGEGGDGMALSGLISGWFVIGATVLALVCAIVFFAFLAIFGASAATTG